MIALASSNKDISNSDVKQVKNVIKVGTDINIDDSNTSDKTNTNSIVSNEEIPIENSDKNITHQSTEEINNDNISSPTYTFTDCDENKYTSNILNVRDNPDINSNIIDSLNIYEQVHITGKCNETGWYRIDYNNDISYVSDKYIINEIPQNTSNTENVSEYDDTVNSITDAFYNDIIYAEGTISVSMLDKVNQKVSLIPSNIITAFKNEGWKVILTNRDIGDFLFDGAKGVCGGTTTYESTIYIANTNHGINAATIHEFGHFIDYYLSSPSSSDEFLNIYNNDRYNVKGYFSDINDSDIGNTREYFATCFYCYIMYGNQLQTIAPASYDYIIKQINFV